MGRRYDALRPQRLPTCQVLLCSGHYVALTYHGPSQSNVPPEVNIARDRQVVKVNHVGNVLEPLLELGDLQKNTSRQIEYRCRVGQHTDVSVMITKLDDRRRREHPVWTEHEPRVLQREQVALEEKEIAARLYREEATSGYVHAVRVIKVAHRGAGGCFELAGVR